MLEEFKKFALRGNVLDLAIGFIMGASFGKIVTSLVSDIIMPPVGLLLGRVDFSQMYINLSGTAYASLDEARKAGAATINYGAFVNTILDFVIVSFVLFLLIRQVNRLVAKPAAPAEPTTKDCPFCCSTIPLSACRCPYCTSMLAGAIAPASE
jgi:large conductance mechanosensitive channel